MRGWGKQEGHFLCAGSQFVRVTPILLQRGEPRTLKHCKNCSQMSVHLGTGARPTFQWPYSPPGPLQQELFGEKTTTKTNKQKQTAKEPRGPRTTRANVHVDRTPGEPTKETTTKKRKQTTQTNRKTKEGKPTQTRKYNIIKRIE